MGTLTELLSTVEGSLSEKIVSRNQAADLCAEIRGKLEIDRTSVSETDATAAIEARSSLDKEIDVLAERVKSIRSDIERDETVSRLQSQISPAAARSEPATRAAAVVSSEPRTYTANKSVRGEASFFADAFRSQQLGDADARDRITRHGKEIRVHNEAMETRAVSSTGFAGLVIPQYLADQYASALRNGRPTANVIRKAPLPAEGMTINVQRLTTGGTVAIQATQNTNVSRTDQVWSDVAVPVVTIAGQQQVSRQSLERGTAGLDSIVYDDLVKAYAAEQDNQILNGSGAAGQMLGLRNSGGTAATLYGAALTYSLFNKKIAGAVAAMAGSGTAIRPRVFIMHPRRWGWITGELDTTGRPITSGLMAQNAAAQLAAGGAYSGDAGITSVPEIVGTLSHNLPVITDANVSTAVGTLNEDQVYLIDPEAHILWQEGDGMPRQLSFEQAPVSGQVNGTSLSTTLVVYGYSAFTAARYPAATGLIGGLDTVAGNGQIAPTF
jgi:HK97 family phage major capsid protein